MDRGSTSPSKPREIKRNRKLKVTGKNATEIFAKKEEVVQEQKYRKIKFPKIKLHFMMTDGSTTDYFIENRELGTYRQLQEEICKLYPHSKSMFMVQKQDGTMLT